MEPTADLGLIGLAVMGQNLALNLAERGAAVAVWNRTGTVTNAFLAGPAAGAGIAGAATLPELVARLRRPRRLLLMVKAGPAVDAVIAELLPLLEPGDIIIDGGNSRYTDTERRLAEVGRAGLLYIGMGISGGEEGARHGPSLMPGGSPDAWPSVRDLFTAAAATTADGTPCCDWVGPGGAGHFVKMVHNGIEYADMQLISEAYGILRATGRDHDALAGIFRGWGRGVLDSYLVDITADILSHRDDDGTPLVEKILDSAGQKGTGRWTVVESMELAEPVSLVAEAVYARILSSRVEERAAAAAILGGPGEAPDVSVEDVHDALYASKIVAYAQGFMLLAAASAEHGWSLDLGRIASLWREGCIIRARFLDDITAAYRSGPAPPSLLLDPSFVAALRAAEPGWRRAVVAAIAAGVPVPAYAGALAFYDGYRSSRLPANLIQAQRDYFGAHTYERVDRPRGEWHHTRWTGSGGETTSGSYDA